MKEVLKFDFWDAFFLLGSQSGGKSFLALASGMAGFLDEISLGRSHFLCKGVWKL